MSDNEDTEQVVADGEGDEAPIDGEDAPADGEDAPTEESSGAHDAEYDETGTLDSPDVEQTSEESDLASSEPSGTFAGRNAVRAIGLVAGIGTFLFFAPVLFTGAGDPMFVQFGIGLALAVVGSIASMKHGRDAASAMGLPLLAAILGALVIALPFVVDVSSQTLQWANVVAGALVVLLALLAIYGFRKDAAAETGFASATR
ncbi:SPW repeat domain-containing protein [Halovivax cerinus]|uniref:SPW repeat-containing integral membrane domain-containing protein n=1 Tax=Halovivax cerinus TaxID=1487865 RepID=A0ABD5NSL4_9EURY|nr:hypothetical protein [Halovivax cerinus]